MSLTYYAIHIVPFDRTAVGPNRLVIENCVTCIVSVLSLCFVKYTGGIGAFVIGLCHIFPLFFHKRNEFK